MTGTRSAPRGMQAWATKRIEDAVILAAGLALALPLILPFV